MFYIFLSKDKGQYGGYGNGDRHSAMAQGHKPSGFSGFDGIVARGINRGYLGRKRKEVPQLNRENTG